MKEKRQISDVNTLQGSRCGRVPRPVHAEDIRLFFPAVNTSRQAEILRLRGEIKLSIVRIENLLNSCQDLSPIGELSEI